MKTIGYLILLTLVFLTPVGAWAQDPPGPGPHGPGPGPMPPGQWWKNSEVVKELQLTDPQVSQIEAAFLEHRKSLIDLRADLEHKELDLQTLMDADRPDTAKVSSQIDAVLAARNKLEKSNAMMLLKIRQVLSVEQWKKLQARHQLMRQREMRMMREREMHMPGMGPGPRRPGMARPEPPGPPPAPPDE